MQASGQRKTRARRDLQHSQGHFHSDSLGRSHRDVQKHTHTKHPFKSTLPAQTQLPRGSQGSHTWHASGYICLSHFTASNNEIMTLAADKKPCGLMSLACSTKAKGLCCHVIGHGLPRWLGLAPHPWAQAEWVLTWHNLATSSSHANLIIQHCGSQIIH